MKLVLVKSGVWVGFCVGWETINPVSEMDFGKHGVKMVKC